MRSATIVRERESGGCRATLREALFAAVLVAVPGVAMGQGSSPAAAASTECSMTAWPERDWPLVGRRGGPFGPAVRTFRLFHDGGGDSIAWRCQPSVEWIQVEPSSGTIEPGGVVEVRCVLHQDGVREFDVGCHEAVVEFVRDGAPPIRRAVRLCVTDEALAPVLEQGEGFAAAGTDPAPAAGADGGPRAIAHYDVVPFQRVRGRFAFGVVAFHASGIESVEFSLDGGAPRSVGEMSLNPRTGVHEYWVWVDEKACRPGVAEVRAVVHPKIGLSRHLSSLKLFVADPDRSEAARMAYVSPNGDDASGDGSAERPFASIMRAANAIQAAVEVGHAGGGVVYLQAGEHTYGQYTWNLRTETANEWLTIRPAPGLSKGDVALTTSGSLKTLLVRLVDLTVRTPISTAAKPEDYVWADDCHFIGEGRKKNTPFLSQFMWSGVYVTNSLFLRNEDGQEGARLLRDVHVREIGSDAFGDSFLVVNCSCERIDPDGTNNHPDVYQFSGEGQTKENFIVYGITARGCFSQAIFADDLKAVNNVAFVNLLLDQDTDAYKSQWKDVSTDHLLFWYVTLLGQDLIWRTPNVTNLSVRGCVWQKLTGGVPDGVFESNHYLDASSYAAQTPGADASEGIPGYVDDASEGIRLAPESALKGRIAQPLVPADVLDRPRGAPSSIGAVD